MTDVAFIDDDDSLRAANVQALLLAGFTTAPYASALEALETIDADFPGVVVTDVRMPHVDGLELFRRLRRIDAEIPVILITGHGDISMAVDAMREGAYDFLTKPYGSDRLLGSIRHALDQRRLVLENRALRRAAEAASDDLPLIGEDPAIERLRQTLRQIADADIDVLIEGETGSGKDVAANALHRWSRRASRPFVAVNCGALPETMIESELFGHEAGAFTGALKKRVGRIEHAHGGTLFLDEIEAMSPALQVKLLRVLESRQIAPLGTNEVRGVDVRVVAATKTDLLTLVRAGSFREDLYYRLHVVAVKVPPLRDRRADVPLLFGHFLARAAKRLGRAQPAVGHRELQYLQSHSWPGNVRELTHFAERVALGLTLDPAPAPATPERPPLPKRVEAFEAEQIREALALNHGDVQATVEALGIPRKTFYDKLHRHGIDQSKYRD
ncbi:sigma-54-dependent Fis family transcriptional regulator [Bradyrhizobium sp. U87765 SZCCT0131]|uniref:sigma-54-dependent transcriptional regulator n=1 Tax=unclassified Bradyrhizobium TaxID=2631580 RepID=UPI001BA64373|nr:MULTISPECIES: sigma-54 dependent transcriptional regulator [unclassified Bradyrhizobium]MBR1220694.1 sigma-54-dependent Fis family transcriptional regulator [Bradyrhizobium sp. U87765 SZCCT0131]MBR1262852.1 sigma-54-dependent Fis family transcriptional regulator [Bradyrhizobium sp. U87765 SZCCT0134]MBR1307266.1 sigma-54-dependent Fis family transcriptional regulator [Bradyrhizobium sp. U87765 SZCCT0110]MBR1322847.1 sigma-54-dependent Fis family transcriptional regulator [Bradyrhizobium sp. U